MDQLLESLQRITKQYLFKKKFLLMPSYLDGHTLQKNLACQGFSALNLHIITLFDLAKEVCLERLIKNRVQILDSPLGQVMILQILKELSSRNRFVYFRLPLMTPGLAKSIFRTIKEMRISGYSSDHWPSELAAGSGKMQDLHQIMSDYEDQLQNRNLIDEADLYSLAIKSTFKEDESIYLVPSNIQMNELELKFFHEKIRSRAYVLKLACPEAMIVPHSFSLTDFRDAGQSLENKVFDFLNHRQEISEGLPDLDITFYQTYGEYMETREVMRTIAEKEIPYDQAQVFYTVQEPYSQYFYQLANLYHIPLTFHNGIHIKNSHPAKLLFSLIDWLNDNYSMARLFSLLNSGCLKLKVEGPLTEQKIASLLRQSPIGWGRDRYIPGIELAIRDRQRKAENTSESKAREYLAEIQHYQAIRDWIQKIFAEIPESHFNSGVSLASLARSLNNIVSRYARKDKNDVLDEEASRIIQEKMVMLEKNEAEKLPFGEALNLISDLIGEERIGCSEPRAGCLHIASYKKGTWMNRPYTFIIGMDSHKFPGSSDEGTLFLDTEKKSYTQLLTDAQKNRIDQCRLLQLILSTRGKKSLSFSCFDTSNQRVLAPASLLLQLYRLKEKNIEENYHSFYHHLGEKRKFIPVNRAEILDIGELFLYLSRQEARDLYPVFRQHYPDFMTGIRADLERKKEELNAYNGKIRVISEKVDPRQNRGIVLSSSRLERIAYCPYLYFLIDILKITPPEEMVYEPTQWMNPLERGLLLHQVYEKFYQTLIKKSEGHFDPPSFTRHWPVLEQIVIDSLEEKRKYLAPPGELIYQAEKREILESCRIFLIGEEKYYRAEIPVFFELAFGTRDNKHEVLGKVKAVEFTLPDGEKISCQGKIDRIDQLPDHTFRIIDYKTGNAKEYREGKPFRHGQQIQHALYAIALEKILAKKTNYFQPRVSLSGYYFPTIQGQGRRVLYNRKDREKVLQIIEIMLNIVARGNFAMIQQPDSFMCQDYQDIMEQNEVISVKGDKSKNYQDEPALDELRRLQQFE